MIANNRTVENNWSAIRRACTEATCMLYVCSYSIVQGEVTGLDILKGDIFYIFFRLEN